MNYTDGIKYNIKKQFINKLLTIHNLTRILKMQREKNSRNTRRSGELREKGVSPMHNDMDEQLYARTGLAPRRADREA